MYLHSYIQMTETSYIGTGWMGGWVGGCWGCGGCGCTKVKKNFFAFLDELSHFQQVLKKCENQKISQLFFFNFDGFPK